MEIKQIIEEVLSGKRELDMDFDPDYYEMEYVDGTEHFIGHYVEGLEGDDFIMLYFPEQEHIIEAREKNRIGDLSDEEFEEMLQNTNDLEDQFNYDKVAGYSDVYGLNWL